MRLLIIEDDERIGSYLKKGLKEAGFVADHATDGQIGLDYAMSADYDAAVVDLMLPGMDGLSVIHYMRNAGIMTPVLILSAKGSVDDRVRGLQAGGDDYMVKPFAFSELLARLHALIRRSHSISEPLELSVGGLKVDLRRRKVSRDNLAIELQPREFELLVYLMQNAGRVVSKTMIMEHVWDYNFDPQTNVVESRICRLRGKVDRAYDEKLIHTMRGVGYVIESGRTSIREQA